MIKIRRALLSVSDKTGLVELARRLAEHNVELIASGGTAAALIKAGLTVIPVEEWTGHPEAMEGRIKTLHPRIHGGLLARRDCEGDMADMERLHLQPIDLLIVNFYPFEQTLSAGKSVADITEAIDVGGPSMVRAAAKNRSHVVVLTKAEQYEEFLKLLEESKGSVPTEFGEACGARAFAGLVAYDSAIANWMNPGSFISHALDQIRPLRYGENPHQNAGLYAEHGKANYGLIAAEKLSGKQLSYNNLLDANGALSLLAEFDEPAAVIIKHVTPCGVGLGDTIKTALERALSTDPVSAFGGIVALNKPMDEAAASVLKSMFLEIILAPEFSDEARQVFANKKALRLLNFDSDSLRNNRANKEFRCVWGGYLVQDADHGMPEFDNLKVVTRRSPTEDEMKALKLGWRVCKHVRSNAIVYANTEQTLGIGAGQMSRVDSAELAVRKAGISKLDLKGSVCASDAFFPFRDGLDIAAEAGATAVIQPGGSVRDDEVIAAANEQNIAMVFTGRRHFRH
ncbi:bifunctional phosphoribosylaminoimidazolecarboxamide formyltransferase/IMP cyclohydrolase [bacterium]|nr:bifunctional phosphoribosylaminoimidazolecarboxamide formyltransferase/IMP cyclohydrolase [bacterium]